MEDAQLAEIRKELKSLHAKVDELLNDSRRARPMLEKYLNSPIANWALKSRKNT